MEFPYALHTNLRTIMQEISGMHPVDAEAFLRDEGVIAITHEDIKYLDQAIHHFCESFGETFAPASTPQNYYYDRSGTIADIKTGVSVPGVFGTQFLRIEVSFPSRSMMRPFREVDQNHYVGFVMMLIDGGRSDKQSQSFRDELNKNLITVGGHLAHDASNPLLSSLAYNIFGGK